MKIRHPFSDLHPFLKIWHSLPVLLVLGLAVHLLVPQIVSMQKSFAAIKSMSLWFLAAAVLAQAASYAGSGYLLRALVEAIGQRISLFYGSLVTLASASIGLVAGGMVGSSAAIVRWLKNVKVDTQTAFLAGLLPALFNNLVLVFLAFLGVIHLLITHDLNTAQAIGFFVILSVLGLVVLFVLIALRRRQTTTDFILRITVILQRVRKKKANPDRMKDNLDIMYTALDSLQQGGWQKPLIGAIVNTGFDMLTLYFVFAATQTPVSPGILLAGYGLPQLLAKAAFIIPGGVGVVETSMIALYQNLGVPAAVTVIVVLGYRLISFWLPSLFGFPVILILERKT